MTQTAILLRKRVGSTILVITVSPLFGSVTNRILLGTQGLC